MRSIFEKRIQFQVKESILKIAIIFSFKTYI